MKKALGQVFLNSQRVASRIVHHLQVNAGDVVLEIGPGHGALTRLLASSCNHLILIEKDRELVEALKARYEPGVRVIEADASEIDLNDILGDVPKARIIGNLPYNASVPILFNLLRRRERILTMVLMFQREVAYRIAAAPDERSRSALSVLVQSRARVERLFDVPPTRFVPVPAVWSTLLRITPTTLDHKVSADLDKREFESFIHALFAQPRKTIANSLADGSGVSKQKVITILIQAGIDPNIRPAQVNMSKILDLWDFWKNL